MQAPPDIYEAGRLGSAAAELLESSLQDNMLLQLQELQLWSMCTSGLVVIIPQITYDNVINPLTYIPVKVGGAVKLVRDKENGIQIIPTEKGTMPDFVVASNETGGTLNVQIGLIPNPRKDPDPIVNFPEVLNSHSVEFKFEPILYAYITSDVTNAPSSTSEIQSPSIWEQDLTKLGDETYWKLTYNEQRGTYQLLLDD
ncbi:SubName: Full=Uncharacterized protein {ECO:0000313/EMBL:CCA71573.1} [Serendipita indica DSM 11827]|nr:SubName: Full=Uncharacterized protein {ECO:0000313/EMBL:CCA71573.1} [Serendipita indica DSM 11827]